MSAKHQYAEWDRFLAGVFSGKTDSEVGAACPIFLQGAPADSVFYLLRGKVKIAARAEYGQEAMIDIVDAGDFFGESCLADHPFQTATATALVDCKVVRIEKKLMKRLLHEHHSVSELFLTHLLSRSLRYEEALLDQLVDSHPKIWPASRLGHSRHN